MTDLRHLLPLIAAALLAACATPADRPGVLTIIHTNDIHSRLLPVNAINATCTERDAAAMTCLGGSARLATAIAGERRAAAAEGRTLLLLDAGDQFQGSLFYTQYRGEAERQVMERIGYQAMAVGNHEFDNGPPVLAAFIRKASFPVLSANIDAANDNDLKGLIRTHAVLRTGIGRVAIIGATVETTPTMSSSGPTVRFLPTEEALPPLIAELKAAGIEKIVLLSHLGLPRDREVASRVEGLDLIVGGHSHTLLSNSDPAAQGPYPVVVRDPSGREVPIVQAMAYGRYLGRIDLRFDAAGNVSGWSGDTRALVQSIPEDPEIKALVTRLGQPLEALRRKPVGAAGGEFSNRACRSRECDIGNLVADAMLAATRAEGAVAALQNGGGLRAGLAAGTVTMGDVLTVLPFQNSIAVLTLDGRDLRQALEHGLAAIEQGAGRFPQVAGIRYAFDAARPAGQRLIRVEIREADGQYRPLADERRYRIATNDFMRRGGDGYAMLRDRAIDAYDFGPGLEDALVEHLGRIGEARPALDGRIERVN